VRRAIGRLGAASPSPGGRVRLSERQLEQLRLDLGDVPRVEG
jgi:hypothetical protein